MRPRRVAAAAVLVIATSLLVLARRCDETSREPPAPSRPAASASSPDADEAPPRTRAHAVPDAATPASIPAPAPAEPLLDGFPALTVRVVEHDGTPLEDATVYAIPAGGDGRQVAAHGPHGTTGRTGRARMALPRFATYDVGVVLGPRHRLLTDVAAPRDQELVFVLPPMAEVVVDATQSAAPHLRDRLSSGLQIFPPRAPGGVFRLLPGRSERLGWGIPVVFDADGRRARILAPSDVPLTMSTRAGFIVAPAAFEAPATVRLDYEEPYHLRIMAHVIPAETAPAPTGWLDLLLEVDDLEIVGLRQFSTRLVDLPPDEDGRRTIACNTSVMRSAGGLEWTGVGVEPGYVEISGLTRDGPNEIAIDVRLLGTPLPETHPRVGVAHPIRLRVAATEGDDRPVSFFVGHARGGGMGSTVPPETVVERRMADAAYLVAHRDLHVAGPLRVSPDVDVHDLALALGGAVEIAVPHPPPASAGRLTLRRTDGNAILSGGALLIDVELRDGTRLGPLPAGGHAFELHLGGERVGDLSVAVTPGSTQIVEIPRLQPAR